MNIKIIKRYLLSKVGCRIKIVYCGSRNRREKYIGIIDKIYYNVFTIRLNNGDIKSFSYSDILTKTIQIYI